MRSRKEKKLKVEHITHIRNKKGQFVFNSGLRPLQILHLDTEDIIHVRNEKGQFVKITDALREGIENDR